MLKVNCLSDVVIKSLLLALVAFVFCLVTIAFGNVVFGVLASAFYVYEVARI